MQQWQFINNFNQLDMFRAIVSPILRSTKLCLQRNYRPKHVELIEVVNKLSLLHLVCCLYYCWNSDLFSLAVFECVVATLIRKAESNIVQHHTTKAHVELNRQVDQRILYFGITMKFVLVFKTSYCLVSFSHGSTALVGLGLTIVEVSISYSDTPNSLGFLRDKWTALGTHLYMKTHNTHYRQTSMPPVGFKTAVPISEGPQTHALDRVWPLGLALLGLG